ncbi:MAG: GNAT family N-acetyltransferase [Acidimicrobiales bacterium]
MTLSVRPAGPADLDEILALVRELAAYEHLEDDVTFEVDEFRRCLFGERPVASVLVAEIDAAVVGFALWFPSFSTFLGRPGIWLEDLFVRPAHHRDAGAGMALLSELRSMTDGRIEWSVLDWNESAIGFYRRIGAQPVEGWTTYRWLPEAGAPPA